VKTLAAPLLWILAVVVALLLVRRVRRGRPLLLRGTFAPRFVRMVVLVLLFFGLGVERAPAQDGPEKPEAEDGAEEENKADPLPGFVDERRIEAWRKHRVERSEWSWLKERYTLVRAGKARPHPLRFHPRRSAVPPALRSMFRAEFEAIGEGEPLPRPPLAGISTALEMEERGFFDPWALAYVWRKTAPDAPRPLGAAQAEAAALARIFARIARMARVHDTLLRAESLAKPVDLKPRPWRSKAAPPRGHFGPLTPPAALARMHALAKGLWRKTDAGTWRRDGAVVVTVGEDSPALTIVRAGGRRAVAPGETARIGRLDLVETAPGERATVVGQAWLGAIALAPGARLTVRDLPAAVTGGVRKRLDEALAAALEGDPAAAERLEIALPFTHRAIAEAVQRSPDAAGAPLLRMVLRLFEW